MSTSSTEQRMIDNEAVFRRHNEEVKARLDELKAIAKEDNQEHMVPDHDMPLFFYCECSDENCRQRVKLKPSHYNAIHKNRRRFVVIPGHESNRIEQTVKREAEYNVVEKRSMPPESVTTLQRTPIDNV